MACAKYMYVKRLIKFVYCQFSTFKQYSCKLVIAYHKLQKFAAYLSFYFQLITLAKELFGCEENWSLQYMGQVKLYDFNYCIDKKDLIMCFDLLFCQLCVCWLGLLCSNMKEENNRISYILYANLICFVMFCCISRSVNKQTRIRKQ